MSNLKISVATAALAGVLLLAIGTGADAKIRRNIVSQQQSNFTSEDTSALGFYVNQNSATTTSRVSTASHNSRSVKYRNQVVTSGNLVNRAYQYVGATAGQLGLPRRLWCADFMNLITGSGSDRRAISYARRGSPASYGCTNCVAVTKRRGGGHVGVVAGYDGRGNPILVSGNHGRRVGIGTYNRRIVVAYRYL